METVDELNRLVNEIDKKTTEIGAQCEVYEILNAQHDYLNGKLEERNAFVAGNLEAVQVREKFGKTWEEIRDKQGSFINSSDFKLLAESYTKLISDEYDAIARYWRVNTVNNGEEPKKKAETQMVMLQEAINTVDRSIAKLREDIEALQTGINNGVKKIEDSRNAQTEASVNKIEEVEGKLSKIQDKIKTLIDSFKDTKFYKFFASVGNWIANTVTRLVGTRKSLRKQIVEDTAKALRQQWAKVPGGVAAYSTPVGEFFESHPIGTPAVKGLTLPDALNQQIKEINNLEVQIEDGQLPDNIDSMLAAYNKDIKSLDNFVTGLDIRILQHWGAGAPVDRDDKDAILEEGKKAIEDFKEALASLEDTVKEYKDFSLDRQRVVRAFLSENPPQQEAYSNEKAEKFAEKLKEQSNYISGVIAKVNEGDPPENLESLQKAWKEDIAEVNKNLQKCWGEKGSDQQTNVTLGITKIFDGLKKLEAAVKEMKSSLGQKNI